MSAYKSTLDAFQKKLLDFIKKYEELDNNEPFSYAITAMLKNEIITYYDRFEKIISKLRPQELAYDEAFDSLSKEYNKKEKALDEKLHNDTKEIQSKYEEKRKVLLEEIHVKEKEIQFEANDILMDIEFFIMASEQNIELFEREYEENVNRFNYQLSIAKESYSNNTIRFNNQLEKELVVLAEKHEKVLVDYDLDTDRIVKHYQKNVEELNAVLARKIEEFNKYQTQIKNERVKESMELNDKIRVLMSERNEKIQKARSEYARKQAEAAEDKENKRQEYQMESQKISREFVLNMSALDDKIVKIKDTYNKTIDQEKRELHYRLLELKKDQERELAIVYASSTNPKKQVHAINSQYYRFQRLEKKNTDKTLKYLSNAFTSDTKKTNYQKKLLDLDRTYNMKYILENESYDNKKYQEINNGFENDMNLSVSISNLDFTKAATELRKENNLKILKEEKNFDESDALHQIETEKLICQIKSIKYEIESFEEIQRLLHKFEDTKYQTTVNFKTVNNVLEVEKCKVLDVLNKSMHDLNVASSKMVYETSKKSTELKNKEYEHKSRTRINRNNLVLNTEQMLVKYQTECFNRDERLEISVLNRNFFYELDSLGHNFLADKFKLEFKKMMQHLSVLTQIIDTLKYMTIEMIDSFYNNIVYRPEYVKIVRVFMNEFIGLIYNGCQRFTENFHGVVEDMIHERLDFEETLKYKGFYRNIEIQYKEDLKVLTDKREIIEKDNNNLLNQIDNNKNTLFSLENDLFMKRKTIRGSKIGPSERNEINDIISQSKALEAENQKFLKRSIVLSKEINHIDDQIAQVNLSYSRQQDEIRKMQVTNAQSYYELQKNLDRHIASSFADFNIKLKMDEAPMLDITNYEVNVKQRCEYYTSLIDAFLIATYTIFHKFNENENEAILKSAEILGIGYKTDLEEIEEEAKVERFNAKNTYAREEAARQEEIEKFDRESYSKGQSIKNQILNHENMIKKYTQDIQKQMDLANQTFYSDYYAICDNQRDIITKQRNDMQKLESDHEANRTAVFARFKKNKEQLKIMLQEYIVSRNEILHHLPEAEKMQEKAIKDEAYKKHNELAQNYVDVKAQNLTTKKEIQKNMDMIKTAFQSKQMEIEREHKISRQKEKKNSLF